VDCLVDFVSADIADVAGYFKRGLDVRDSDYLGSASDKRT